MSKNKIFTALLAGCWLFTSCGNDSQIAQSEWADNTTRSVMFNIPLASDDIDCQELQIFLYDTTGVEMLTPIEISSLETLSDGSQMVHGLIPVDSEAVQDKQLNGHLLILGNCGKTDGSLVSVQQMTFAANPKVAPMVGSHAVSTRLDERMEVLCPTTSLLRSSARVTVRLSEQLKNAGITLSHVTLVDGNLTGYCAPKEVTAYNTSAEQPVAQVFNPNDSNKGNIELRIQTDGDAEGLIPECQKPDEGALSLEIGFSRDGNDYTGTFGHTIYFKNYTDQQPFDIVRGHHYLFTIRSLQTEGELIVEVEDWNEKQAQNVVFE